MSYFTAMDKGALLQTIADSKLFFKPMGGVDLGDCAISIVSSMARVQPTAEELALSKVLEGMQTLGEVVASMAAGNIWMHVQTSTRAAAKGESL